MYRSWSVQLSVDVSRRPRFTIFNVNSSGVSFRMTLESGLKKGSEVLTLLPMITLVFNSFNFSPFKSAQVANTSASTLNQLIAFSTSSGSQFNEICVIRKYHVFAVP